MKNRQFGIENKWMRRSFHVDENLRFTTSEVVTADLARRLASSGDEFKIVVYIKEFMLIFTCADFQYVSHHTERLEGREVLRVQLSLNRQLNSQLIPFAVGEVEPLEGDLLVTLEYICYGNHPVIRKRLWIQNEFSSCIKLQNFAWEDLQLSAGAGRYVVHNYLTQTSSAMTNNMDDCMVAVAWPDKQDVLLLATEAPGSMKRMEVFDDGDRAVMLYNNKEETIFEYSLEPHESFDSDYSFLLYAKGKWEDAVDGPYQAFVKEELCLLKPENVPTFTVNTWETFYNDINDEIVVDNIKLASELGIDAYQLDCGWYMEHGDYRPHSSKFPNGLAPVVEACRKAQMDLGVWMSVPNVQDDTQLALEHPEWFLLDENGDRGFMMCWQKTHTMCLDSDYKYWILDKIDEVIKAYGVKLLKLDLASVRDPYNPGKSIGCHAKHHHHNTHKSSYIRIYRSLFWIMDELRKRNPSCIIDLTFELYGVLHGTDLAHIQHAHQNWIINMDTSWIDMLRKILYTRSRIVPSYTLNFGSCHLTDALAGTYGFWSALLSHGLYYGDLRKLSAEEKAHYRKWIHWVKAFRAEKDFYSYFRVSDALDAPDTGDHRDRRYHPYSYYEAGRVDSHAAKWDGAAKVNESGEGLVLIFRPAECLTQKQVIRLPWAIAGSKYKVTNVLEERDMGIMDGAGLEAGLEFVIDQHPGVLVLALSKA